MTTDKPTLTLNAELTPEQREQKQGEIIMKATRAYADLVSQIMEEPVHVVMLSRPVGRKRTPPGIASHSPGTVVYEMLVDGLTGMTEAMQEDTSVIEDAHGKRMVNDPKIKLTH